ncbi:MAG: hypothetical protein GY795_27215, partial [Desulfobacterales bacterium]|nr:hypothetical protein [Desulfobacterales bacterium]
MKTLEKKVVRKGSYVFIAALWCMIICPMIAAGASIGDFIWEDVNADGVQDTGENGISSVTVNLIEPGPDGVFDTGDDWVLGTEATDETGHYIFTDLGPGLFRIHVTDTNLVLGWYVLTGGINPFEITLSEFQDYQDADFGYKKHDNAIGGFIWDDMNGDGVQDADEPGIASVTVDLIEPGPDGVFDTGDDWVLVTEATDETGHYIFTGLWPATYRVNITDTNHVLGWYVQTGGAVLPQEVSLTLFEHYMAADFGYRRHDNAIGDFIWDDMNGDGVQD